MEPMVVVMLLAIGFAVLFVIQVMKNNKRARAEEKVLKGYFLLGLSGIMAKLAMADGKVTDDETAMAQKFFAGMDLTDAEKATCIGNFVVARRDGLDARDHANRFLAYANRAACEFLYDMLWRIAMADGTLDSSEDKLLVDIALYLGLDRQDYERLKRGERGPYDKQELIAAGVPSSFVGLVR